MREINLSDILSTENAREKKVGYVAIIGRPNVGKSTFVNALIWEKISIVSRVPQTTRKRIFAIFNDDESQIIFFDTPWIHQSDKVFNTQINHQALTSLREAEAILYFIDTSRPLGDEEKYIEEILENYQAPLLRVYTKTDLKPVFLLQEWDDIFQISSLSHAGFGAIITRLKSLLPKAPLYYPEEYYTDQNMHFRISEVVREKVFLHTKEEIPHSIFVEVSEIDEEAHLIKIQAYIHTETDSQRYILIGKWGSLVTLIGKEARLDLENIFGKPVFLSLRVKTMEKWRKNEKLVKNMLK